MFKSTIQWKCYRNELPVVPEGKHAVRTLVAVYTGFTDNESDEVNWDVRELSFDRKDGFIDFLINGHSQVVGFSPCMEMEVYWAYLPKIPKVYRVTPDHPEIGTTSQGKTPTQKFIQDRYDNQEEGTKLLSSLKAGAVFDEAMINRLIKYIDKNIYSW